MIKEILEEDKKLSPKTKKEVLDLIKEILKTEKTLKAKADKLDKKYKKETGNSIFFQWVYNDKPLSQDDYDFVNKSR